MHGKARWPAVLGRAGLASAALLAIVSLAGGSIPAATAQNGPACTVNGITANPTTGQTGIPTTFTLNTSNCTQAQTSALVVVWSFGDGTTGTTNPATHTYTQANTYTVVAQVTGSATATVSLQYMVIQGLTITTNGPYTGAVGQPITMTASGTSLPADTTFSWDFGDHSAAATGATVSHAYLTSGTYTVTVTATSASSGRAGMASTTATIGTSSPAPTLSISGPTQVTAGQSVSYSVSASGSVPSDYSYSWSFGDGGTATGPSVTHTFANPGNFTVTVTATSASTPSANTTASTAVVVSQAAPTGPQVVYPAGWNLVGGPTGTTFTQANGPLYTYQAGDTAYENQPNSVGITGGRGYWAYFNTATTVSLNGASTTTASLTAPAGQWIMVGNPSSTQTLTVHGADAVYTWDTTTGAYVAATTVAPGHGVWAISLNGGTITVGP